MKQTIIKTTFLFFILISFFNCEKEEVTTDQQSNIETVSINEALDLFSQSYKTSKSSKTNNKQFIIPQVDKISQEEIINSNELLTIIPATTFEGVYSRILLIKIDGEIKPVVFSMVKDEQSDTPEFSGMIYIHTLEKEYINTLKAENGVLVSRFKKPIGKNTSKNITAKGEDDCFGIGCGMRGEEVVINAKKDQRIEFTYVFRFEGGDSDDGGQSWSYGEGQESGGSSGTTEPANTTCDPGYAKDNDGNCVAEILVEEPNRKYGRLSRLLWYFTRSQLTIYVDQPIANSNEPFTTGAGKAGHAFIGIVQNGVTRVWGLYPESNATPFSSNDPHAFGNNQGDNFDVSITTIINAASLQNILDDAINYPLNYDLNTNNCTDYVLDAAQLSSILLPDPQSNWTNGGGSNPGAFGEALRELDLPQGMTRNNNGGNAPQNSADCN